MQRQALQRPGQPCRAVMGHLGKSTMIRQFIDGISEKSRDK